MRAVDQWLAIERGLADEWIEIALSFVVEDTRSVPQAAAVLAPLQPGRGGRELRFRIRRRGGEPAKLRNLLGRLDTKRIWGALTLVGASAEPRGEPARALQTLVLAWEAELERLPAGWRDLLCELELDSTDFLARAALLGAPLNPSRNPEAIALRFRVSRGGGYGAAPEMVRRCLERMDAERLTGRVKVLTVLSDTDDVATLGPVWRIGGRSV